MAKRRPHRDESEPNYLACLGTVDTGGYGISWNDEMDLSEYELWNNSTEGEGWSLGGTVQVVQQEESRQWRSLIMSKIGMMYLEKDDVLHLAISDEPEAGSVELSPNITAELNDKGEMIGIEILEASRFIRDSIMESVQARVSRVPELQPV